MGKYCSWILVVRAKEPTRDKRKRERSYSRLMVSMNTSHQTLLSIDVHVVCILTSPTFYN